MLNEKQTIEVLEGLFAAQQAAEIRLPRKNAVHSTCQPETEEIQGELASERSVGQIPTEPARDLDVCQELPEQPPLGR